MVVHEQIDVAGEPRQFRPSEGDLVGAAILDQQVFASRVKRHHAFMLVACRAKDRLLDASNCRWPSAAGLASQDRFSKSALASRRSGMSKPSVNQP